MATNAANLRAIKASLLQSLADETAYQQTHGPRDTYSLDGEAHDWPSWRTAILEQVKSINLLLQQENNDSGQGPAWMVHSRQRG